MGGYRRSPVSKTIELGVQGMTCASCTARVERGLRKVEGVEGASVNLATERATVTFDPTRTTPQALLDKVRDVGYEPVTSTVDLGVTGMTCASCSSRVERALKKVDGVLSASVNLATERATVTYLPSSVSVGQLKATIRDAGYDVLEGQAGVRREDQEREAREREVTDLRRSVALSAVFAVPLLPLAMVPMLVPAVEDWLMATFGHDVM